MKGYLVLRVVAKVFLPFILLFALYVQFQATSVPAAASRRASSSPQPSSSTR
jgi:hypothetical protein